MSDYGLVEMSLDPTGREPRGQAHTIIDLALANCLTLYDSARARFPNTTLSESTSVPIPLIASRGSWRDKGCAVQESVKEKKCLGAAKRWRVEQWQDDSRGTFHGIITWPRATASAPAF